MCFRSCAEAARAACASSRSVTWLEPPYAVESARAETYCDVVSLPCRALREIFNKDKFWDGVATTFRFAQGPADSPTPSLGGSPTSAPSSKKQSPLSGSFASITSGALGSAFAQCGVVQMMGVHAHTGKL